MTISVAKFTDFFSHYVGESHQEHAVLLLYKELTHSAPKLLNEQAPWIEAYRATPQQLPLNVPYFSQNDNASGTGYRECFSSSCAMVAAYYGRIGTDDEYNLIRARYGDTTSAEAQLRALRSLGLKADFHTDGSPAKLKTLLSNSVPVPVGWLHKGHVTRPNGGGHWSVITGTTDSAWIVNDPNGQADLINGGYTADPTGKAERYSYRNFDPRWMADGPSTGWYMTITK